MLWSVGRFDLEFSEEEFWKLTMREYEALLERRNSRQEFDLYNTAAVVCAIYNVNRDPKKHPEPFRPDDFLGKKKALDEQTPEQMLEMVKVLHAAFGGKPPVGE